MTRFKTLLAALILSTSLPAAASAEPIQPAAPSKPRPAAAEVLFW